MKTLKELAEKHNKIMKITKMSEIAFVIAKSNLGELTIKLPFQGTRKDYRFYLDSVPFDDEKNKQLLEEFNEILFDSLSD